MTSSSKPLGAAKAAALQNSLQTAPTAGIGDAFGFTRAAGRAIDQMRAACKDFQLPPHNPIIVTYVFCDNLEAVADQSVFEGINLLWTSDLSILLNHIENRIILISRNGGAGCMSKATYSAMREHACAVAALKLHDSPAVVFQLSSSKATMYPHGIASSVFEHSLFGTAPSLLVGQELDNVLNHFDKTWTDAQPGHAKLWAHIDKCSHVPCANTEKVIQEHMQLALASADRSGVVVNEIPNEDGRADLLLYSDIPGGRHSVVLELKVLRSFSFPSTRSDGKVSSVPNKTNETNALEVVTQASCYKTTLKAQRACARLYDMREPPINVNAANQAQTLAKSLNVELCVSQIHHTTQAKRNDKVAQVLAQQTANNGQS